MLTIRYWTPGRHADAITPLGGIDDTLRDAKASERALRSVCTWATQGGLAFRVGLCGDPRDRAQQLESTLVELSSTADGIMVHGVYVRKPWRYMHVLHRTSDVHTAERMLRRFIDIGRNIGRCENNERDLLEPLLRGPYFVYLVTGELPERSASSPAPEHRSAPSLLSMAGM